MPRKNQQFYPRAIELAADAQAEIFEMYEVLREKGPEVSSEDVAEFKGKASALCNNICRVIETFDADEREVQLDLMRELSARGLVA